MPTVADYAVLQDAPVEIDAGQVFETRPFFRPDGFVAGTDLAKAILAFKVHALPEVTPTITFAPLVSFTITKLSASLPEIYRTTGINVGLVHGLWETFPATEFGANVGTRFLFSVSDGRVRFSDVVLWYQVRV